MNKVNKSKINENTLVLGNGFSRAIFKNMPSWKDLFIGVQSGIKNYTILYEVFLIRKNYKKDDLAKKKLIKNINKIYSSKNINKNIRDLRRFGEFLIQNNIFNIITTNFDNGIELILCEICGYKEIEPEGMVAEEVYSIRTYKEFINRKLEHRVKLWKIHGDIDRIKSVTLGFDQYCGSISKLSNYVKGTYKSDKGPQCHIKMEDKCKMNQFDKISWAELFFRTNVYIVGLALDFSEIDIWWLLNKRIRIQSRINPPEDTQDGIMNLNESIQNKIYYLYNKKYDKSYKKGEKCEALSAFGVKSIGIKSGKNYIKNIFNKIK